MSKPLIEVRGLGKRYNLGETLSHDMLRERISHSVRRVFGGTNRKKKSQSNFWALSDVTFDVEEGEVLGVIGRNGAGKSTLLKILSRITEPTTGYVRLRGRVASLLEVGTGFHKELTGRENVYLNGAILGMSRANINRKFAEIVEFAGVESFIDTPVKRYSSGMTVRLAFAVAAHLEPEILIIDEVLAVGDADFQKRCLGKMGEVSKSGRTIIFVSHNMGAISQLCDTGLLLASGRVEKKGDLDTVIHSYLGRADAPTCIELSIRDNKPSITSVKVDQESLKHGNLEVSICFESPFPLDPPIGGILLTTEEGVPVYGSNTRVHNDGYNSSARRSGTLVFRAENLPVAGCSYFLSVWLADWQTNFQHEDALLQVDFPNIGSTKLMPRSQGSLVWPCTWHLEDR